MNIMFKKLKLPAEKMLMEKQIVLNVGAMAAFEDIGGGKVSVIMKPVIME